MQYPPPSPPPPPPAPRMLAQGLYASMLTIFTPRALDMAPNATQSRLTTTRSARRSVREWPDTDAGRTRAGAPVLISALHNNRAVSFSNSTTSVVEIGNVPPDHLVTHPLHVHAHFRLHHLTAAFARSIVVTRTREGHMLRFKMSLSRLTTQTRLLHKVGRAWRVLSGRAGGRAGLGFRAFEPDWASERSSREESPVHNHYTCQVRTCA